jgi:hypothetical protein
VGGWEEEKGCERSSTPDKAVFASRKEVSDAPEESGGEREDALDRENPRCTRNDPQGGRPTSGAFER